jgi:hypothetical protein
MDTELGPASAPGTYRQASWRRTDNRIAPVIRRTNHDGLIADSAFHIAHNYRFVTD